MTTTGAGRGIRTLLVLDAVWRVCGKDYHLACGPLDAKKPCLWECGGSPILRYDFSLLQPTTMPYIQKQDSGGHNYFFDACTPMTQVSCGGACAPGATQGHCHAAAVQSWGGMPPSIAASDCAWLGDYGTRNCTVQPAPLGSGQPPSMVCNYIQGQDGRSVMFKYECASDLPTPTYEVEQTTSNSYTIRLRGQGACGKVWQRPLSLGSMCLIFAFVGATLYLAGGISYNVKARGTPSPHVASRPTLRMPRVHSTSGTVRPRP